MLFNSVAFLIFLPIVFALYWSLNKKSLGLQNAFVLIASYIFYGWWDWRFLILIFLSTLVDFHCGSQIEKANSRHSKKIFLGLSLLVNLGVLGFFKYFGFFVDSWVNMLESVGYITENTWTLNIVLPVGISFYTFQTLSYTIDIYRGKVKTENSFINFAAFVSFFPQLVAGPIERATHLLPQFQKKREFRYLEARAGLQQILWGFFKKIVIADNCGYYADLIFNDPQAYSGSTLAIGALLFAFQIYADFSGYSDIAIGTARLFGFRLMKNFSTPYFSKNIREFWQRWHISLSTWFRDYVYIPLGGSRVSKLMVVRNIFIVFVLSGLWHGANFTFLIWGFLHALFFMPMLFMKKKTFEPENPAFTATMMGWLKMLLTFALVCFSWIFFRSASVTDAFLYIQGMIGPDLFSVPEIKPLYIFLLIAFMLVVEAKGKNREFEFQWVDGFRNTWLRWGLYIFIGCLLGLFMYSEETPFIYFQF